MKWMNRKKAPISSFHLNSRSLRVCVTFSKILWERCDKFISRIQPNLSHLRCTVLSDTFTQTIDQRKIEKICVVMTVPIWWKTFSSSHFFSLKMKFNFFHCAQNYFFLIEVWLWAWSIHCPVFEALFKQLFLQRWPFVFNLDFWEIICRKIEAFLKLQSYPSDASFQAFSFSIRRSFWDFQSRTKCIRLLNSKEFSNRICSENINKTRQRSLRKLIREIMSWERWILNDFPMFMQKLCNLISQLLLKQQWKEDNQPWLWVRTPPTNFCEFCIFAN